MPEGDEVRNDKRPTLLRVTLRFALCGAIAILLAACSPVPFVSGLNPFTPRKKRPWPLSTMPRAELIGGIAPDG